MYASRNLLDWAIEHRQDRKMIGRMGLHAYHALDQRAELGYAFNRNYWGQGYATEAAKCLLEYGFNTLKLHRISATVLPDNVASMRVLEKLGMIREGVKRDGIAIRGKHEDLLCYSILRPDYLRYNQPDSQHNPGAHS
jgi:ribosomal-protein-alanine N-acetyltransferase